VFEGADHIIQQVTGNAPQTVGEFVSANREVYTV
jgi:hypothetical protein